MGGGRDPPAFGTISGGCFLLEVDKSHLCRDGIGPSIKNQVHLKLLQPLPWAESGMFSRE